MPAPKSHIHAPNAQYYEVFCARCQVSFPLGTRTCLHCGGPVTHERGRRRYRVEDEPELDSAPIEEAPDELPSRSGVLSPMALVWLALVIGGALYRSCASG